VTKHYCVWSASGNREYLRNMLNRAGFTRKDLLVEPHGQSPRFLIKAPVGRHLPSKLGTGWQKDGTFVLSRLNREGSSAAGVRRDKGKPWLPREIVIGGFEKLTYQDGKESL
jgi:hypothetical protein